MMIIDRGICLVKKALHLGPYKTARVLKQKMYTQIFCTYWRRRALQKLANHTWHAVQERHNLSCPGESFLVGIRQKQPCFLAYMAEMVTAEILKEADLWIQNICSILGSALHTYEALPWHEDIRLKQLHPEADYRFPANLFYKDIVIKTYDDHLKPGKDIKVPWELSRFQHLIILAQAYRITGCLEYATTYRQHIDDWLDKNPYMLGVNWVCPMEVGLRAINWIISFFLLQPCSLLTSDFCQRFSLSLYDHMHYLENNWEIYDDRTSNHYLSDLVGYMYLCYFFQDLPGVLQKAHWCFDEIMRECSKQVGKEGTSYEGSTAYHYLVAELFIHAYLVACELLLPIPLWFEQRVGCMLSFIDWCSYEKQKMITIGDNDSGQVTRARITPKMRSLFNVSRAEGSTHFSDFGISIIKREPWHISLRSHAYQPQQPTGHFHNDVGSLTVALDGIPLFVDSGSYLYTPSALWRNYFRSVTAHSTVSIEREEPIPLTTDLFKLDLAISSKNQLNSAISENEICALFPLKNDSDFYCARSIKLRDETKVLLLSDRIYSKKNTVNRPQKICWHFVVAPCIRAICVNECTWQFYVQDHLLATMQTSICLQLKTSWVSPSYGTKVTTISLSGSSTIDGSKDFQADFKIMVY